MLRCGIKLRLGLISDDFSVRCRGRSQAAAVVGLNINSDQTFITERRTVPLFCFNPICCLPIAIQRTMLQASMLSGITGSSRLLTTTAIAQRSVLGSFDPSWNNMAQQGLRYRQQQQQRDLTVKSLDHLVITCHDINRTIDFYSRLGMGVVEFGQGRKALEFGSQKINLHQKGKEL